MPGLFGFTKESTSDSDQHMIAKMLAVSADGDYSRHSVYMDDQIAVGISRLAILPEQQQPIWNEDHSTACFMLGELFGRASLATRYQSQVDLLSSASDLQWISSLYEKVGNTFLTHLNGNFLILIWEQKTRKLTIANDRMGLYPIYYAILPNGLIFGTQIKAMLVDERIERRVDQTAIAEFLTFDHMLGQHTLLQNIKLLPQASILEFSNGSLNIEPYYQYSYLSQFPVKRDEEYIAELDYLMKQAVKRQMTGNLTNGLLLSGGLDSRYLLAVLAEENPGNIHTFTWSIPGSDDARYAAEVANKAGSHHHFYPLEPDWLSNKAERAVLLTSGNGNVINLHAIATLEQEATISPVIYKGFMGDAMFGFGIRPRFWADYDQDTLIEQHLEAYRDYRVLTFDPKEHSEFFSDAFYHNTRQEWRSEFQAGMLACGCNQMASQRSYFDLTQRVPRMTINGVDVVRDRAVVRLPFTDNDLVEFSLTIPPHLLYQRQLVDRTFIQTYPQYAKIPIAQTRLPMMTCAREVWMRNIQFIQWHLRERGLNKLAGPASRPYKDYHNWFRHELKAMVEGILLDPRSLDRGYLKPEKIQQLVQEHMDGQNLAVRLGALLSIEIAHRMLVD